MVRRLYFIIGLILGFILCAHWDWGRNFVQDVSPIYTSPLKKGLDKVKQGVEKTGENFTEKVKEELSTR